jgi:hypothetical protein
MIGRLSEHSSCVWGSQEAVGYLRQDPSNFARCVQCSDEVGVQVSGEERILPSEPSVFFS